MSKKMIILAMALALVTGTAAVSFAVGCNEGVAKAVHGIVVTVLCKDGSEFTAEDIVAKGSGKIEVKDKVVVLKSGKVKKKIEGC